MYQQLPVASCSSSMSTTLFNVPHSTIFKHKMVPSKLSASLNEVFEKTVDPLDSVPLFASHQLLGDSIMVRFAKNVLKIPSNNVNGSATVGYCVSGQRIKQLTKRIKEYEYKIEDKVIILIGTNDILCGRSLESMQMHFDKLIMLLQLRMVTNFVILTLPPVPKLALMKEHWACLHGFNKYLRQHHDPKHNFHVVDVSTKFLKQESPFFKPKVVALSLDRIAEYSVSPKRKATCPLASTPKKRKTVGLLADDKNLNPFEAYINKVNRREWEEDAVSSDDEGWIPSIRHYVDDSFWSKLKETIIVENEDKLPPMADLQLSLPMTPTKPGTLPESNKKPYFNPMNRRLMALVKNFIRLDYYEMFFYNQRMDMVHPNEAGLRAIETMLNHEVGATYTRRAYSL